MSTDNIEAERNGQPSPVVFVALSKEDTAKHEAGHAAIACAIGVDFQHVEVHPDPKVAWVGQCLPTTLDVPDIKLVAFQMGGPLMQLTLVPGSLGEFLPLVQESLFTHATEFLLNGNNAIHSLCWAGDLIQPGFMGWAHWMNKSKGAPKGCVPKDWLFELEREIRRLFENEATQGFASWLAEELVTHDRIAADAVRAKFNEAVPAEVIQPLISLVSQHH